MSTLTLVLRLGPTLTLQLALTLALAPTLMLTSATELLDLELPPTELDLEVSELAPMDSVLDLEPTDHPTEVDLEPLEEAPMELDTA